MTTAPQTLAQEAVDAVNALIAESDRLRDWDSPEVQSLIPMMKRLQKSDARRAFIRMGGLSAICGKVDEVLDYYRKAIQLGGELETKHEFWIAMGNCGLYQRSHELGSWLLDPRRGFFPKIWARAASFGHLLEVCGRVAEAKKTYPELAEPEVEANFSELERAAEVMRERSLTDEDVVSVLELIGEVQRIHRLMFAGGLVTLIRIVRPPEDPPYLYLTIPMSTDVAEIHAMNRKFTKLVAEKLPTGVFPSGLVCAFEKAHFADLAAAA